MPPLCSIVAAHLTALIALAIDVFHDTLGIFLWNFKVRHGLQQVNMSHFYMAVDVLIEKLHQFTRIETVLLAQVDE